MTWGGHNFMWWALSVEIYTVYTVRKMTKGTVLASLGGKGFKRAHTVPHGYCQGRHYTQGGGHTIYSDTGIWHILVDYLQHKI